MKRPLPYQQWRTKEGQLFARGGEFSPEELFPAEAMKFPLLLGTFQLDLGTVSFQ